MKSMLVIVAGLLFCFASTAQTSTEVTPELQKKFKLEIEKEIPKKQQLEKDKVNAAQIEFVLDTFRVNYSGGGTMQQLTEPAEYLNLIKERTIAIFDHYIRATQNY